VAARIDGAPRLAITTDAVAAARLGIDPLSTIYNIRAAGDCNHPNKHNS
jgi:hypothetical protein